MEIERGVVACSLEAGSADLRLREGSTVRNEASKLEELQGHGMYTLKGTSRTLLRSEFMEDMRLKSE